MIKGMKKIKVIFTFVLFKEQQNVLDIEGFKEQQNVHNFFYC